MEDWDLVYGLHDVQREPPAGVVEADGDPANRVLITAGVGTTPPFRLGIPPEVVLLTLVPRA
jgi:predicted MPP superfamily phosphohydrolase